MMLKPIQVVGMSHGNFAGSPDIRHLPPRAVELFRETYEKSGIERRRLRNEYPAVNFRIETISEQGRCALSLIPNELSSESFCFNDLLDARFHITNGSRNFTGFSKRSVELPMHTKDRKTFSYDALHEISHSQRELDERLLDSPYEKIKVDFNASLEKGHVTDADIKEVRRKILAALNAMNPENPMAKERHAAMLNLLNGKTRVDDYLSQEDDFNARTEREAWRYAETQIRSLENRGYDFGFPETDRESYVQNCLMNYDLDMLLGKFYVGGILSVRNSNPVFSTDERYTSHVRDIIQACS